MSKHFLKKTELGKILNLTIDEIVSHKCKNRSHVVNDYDTVTFAPWSPS